MSPSALERVPAPVASDSFPLRGARIRSDADGRLAARSLRRDHFRQRVPAVCRSASHQQGDSSIVRRCFRRLDRRHAGLPGAALPVPTCFATWTSFDRAQAGLRKTRSVDHEPVPRFPSPVMTAAMSASRRSPLPSPDSSNASSPPGSLVRNTESVVDSMSGVWESGDQRGWAGGSCRSASFRSLARAHWHGPFIVSLRMRRPAMAGHLPEGRTWRLD